MSVNDERADMFPELGQSVASGAFQATKRDTCDESGDELFRISFASEADLAELSDIYAGVAIADPLACCLIKQPHRRAYHVAVGRFYYGEAFAAKGEDVVLKVTNQKSGEIVGCAWLQLLPYPESDEIEVPLWQPGSILPDCIKMRVFPYIHRLRHEQIQTTIKKKERQTNGLPHYRKYLPDPHYKTQGVATDARGQYADYCVPLSH